MLQRILKSTLLASWSMAPAALAQAGVTPLPRSMATSPDVVQLVVSLLLILALIIGAAWAVKRFQLLGPRNTGSLRIVSSLALGPKERLLLVEAGERRLLLGVSSAGIVTLDVNSPGRQPAATGPAAFSRQLDPEVRQWAAGS